jgi:hypothetical protein
MKMIYNSIPIVI